jgi:hypothetical protein
MLQETNLITHDYFLSRFPALAPHMFEKSRNSAHFRRGRGRSAVSLV